MQPKPLILLVEDEADLRELLVEFLEREGYRIASAVDWPQGPAMLRASPPALLITNVRLPGGSGRDLEKLARAMDVPVLLISAHPQDIELRRDVAFLKKPFRLSDLKRAVEKLLVD